MSAEPITHVCLALCAAVHEVLLIGLIEASPHAGVHTWAVASI